MRDLIGILRGVLPGEVEAIASVIYEAGIHKIEVTMNSPSPLESIEKLSKLFDSDAVIGAGTVLSPEQVKQVSRAGGQMIVSPNFLASVVLETKQQQMFSYPGVFTASECFQALSAGADGLKLFPASVLGLDGFKALRAVLPEDTLAYGVSGIGPDEFALWRSAGLSGFGIGSHLYKAGMSTNEVKRNAIAMVNAFDAASGGAG